MSETSDQRTTVIVLDRIEDGFEPDYCCHGRATCVGECGEWVWLGDTSYEIVASGRAAPLCRECAARLVPATETPFDHVDDHRRADGPHA